MVMINVWEIDKVGTFCAFYYKVGTFVSISKIPAILLVLNIKPSHWLSYGGWAQLPPVTVSTPG